MTDKENKDSRSNDDIDNREEIITKIIEESPAEFILQELKEAYERQWNLKVSHEKKAASIIIIAGILTSLLLGFAGYLHTNNLQLVPTSAAFVPFFVVIPFIITSIITNSAAVVFSILRLRMTKIRRGKKWKSIDLALRMRNHFVLQNKIQWVKSISIRNSNFSDRTDFQDIVTIGHHQPLPPTCARFLNSCYEDIYHFTKKGCIKLDKTSIGVPYKHKSNINRWASVKQDLRDRGNVWFIPYDTIQNKSERPHPATFPIKLPEMCIKLHGRLNQGTMVLDPFCGIGSTAVASMKLGVSWLGFDINKEFLDTAISRF